MIVDMPRGRPSTKPRSDFGQRLAEARQKAGLSQAELGERLGMTQRAIAHWERRRVSLYPEQIETLCVALKISAEELLGFNGKARDKPGPKSEVRRQLEEVEQLPRKQQKQIAGVVSALVTQAKAAG
jgi:transcriptional regulator with XRE-family HTH domain